MADLEQHAARIAEMIQQIESGEEPPARERVFELLEHIDHLHRTCVWRLFELVTELGGKGLIDRVAADPAVKTLFMLYDLIPSEPLRPVVSTAPVTGPHAGGLIPVESLRLRGRSPDWKIAFAQSDLPPGSLQGVEVDGTPVLLCGVEGGVFAYRNGCGGGVLPLHLGVLAEGEIRCPWHGCRYDVRTGRRLDGAGPDLEAFAVSVRDGTIHVAARTPA
jgi:nitrite reductase (NADH) small subunit/3-phenylpropionate/trans-cinnamate dioxygenase ferredoxin subunit